MNCPHCGKPIPPRLIRSDAARQAGEAGRGYAKARTSDQARAAVQARWANHRHQRRTDK